jgi:hypothetical protein
VRLGVSRDSIPQTLPLTLKDWPEPYRRAVGVPPEAELPPPGAAPSGPEVAVAPPVEPPVVEPTPTPPVAPAAEWVVPGWTDTAAKDHPFHKICPVVRVIKIGPDTAVVGVCFGEPAKAKSDKAYQDFKAQIEDFWTKECRVKDRNTSTQKIDQTEFDRINATGAGKMGVAMVGIQDGRCVAFWFEGSSNCFAQFSGNFAKAKPTAVPAPTTRIAPPLPRISPPLPRAGPDKPAGGR